MKTGYGTVIDDCSIGEGTVIWHHCNLYRCHIGKNCKIASFVEIGEGVSIGNNCKIEAYSYIPTGVTIGDSVFIGAHVVFTNIREPTISEHWTIYQTIIKDGAAIDANSLILAGVVVGENAVVDAGSCVDSDVPAKTVWKR